MLSTRPDYTVAIVEDEAILHQELAFQLECLGFTVAPFATAAQLYRYLAMHPKTVVVLDIGLVGEDGLSVCQYLRAYDINLGMIFVTAHNLRSDRLAGLNLGADAYLVKPIDIEELALILKHLSQPLLTVLNPESRPTDDGQWRLEENPTFLIAPNQTRIRLSTNEYQLMKALFQQPDAPCPHVELTMPLNLRPEEYHKHQVEVTLSRLRERVLRLIGLQLPLQAEHNLGYRLYDL